MKKKNISLESVFVPRGKARAARAASVRSGGAPGDISGYDGRYGFSCSWAWDCKIAESAPGVAADVKLTVSADDSATLTVGSLSVSASYDSKNQCAGSAEKSGALTPGVYRASLSFTNIDYKPPENNVAALSYSIEGAEDGTEVPTENNPAPENDPCDCPGEDAGGDPASAASDASRARSRAASETAAASSSSAGRNTRLTATETYARWRTDFGAFRGMGGIPAGELEILAYSFSEKLASPETLEFSHPLNSWLALPEGGVRANAQLKVFTGGSYASWICDGSGAEFFPIGASSKSSAALSWNAGKTGLCLTFPDKSMITYSAETGEIVSYRTKNGNAFSSAEIASYLEILRDGDGVLRQVRNLWDGLMNVENETSGGYEIALYLPENIGAKSEETGLYAVSGAAFKRFAVSLSSGGKLTITERDAREGAPAFPRSVWFENGAWNTSVGSGGEEIFTRRSRGELGESAFRIVTEVSRGTESVPASRVAETYELDEALGALRVSRTEGFGSDCARTTSYVCDDCGRVVRETRPDGSVVESTYDVRGRLSVRSEPFAGARCRTTYYGYASSSTNSADLSSVKVVLSRTNGPLTLSTTNYSRSETSEYRREERRTTALGAEGERLEVEETWLGTCGNVHARGRVKMRQTWTGVQTHYDYAGTSLHGALYAQTAETRVAGAAVAGKSEREVRFISSDGNVTRAEKYALDSAGTWRLVASADFEYDARNNWTKRTRGNGRVSRREMMCCGALWEIDEDGVRTDYSYDSAQRLTEKMRASTATMPERITLYERDAEGRVTRETLKLDSVNFSEKAAAFDLLGRTVSETDELGRTATRAYAVDPDACATTETVTLPSGATRVTKTHADGTVLAETGTSRRNVEIVADSYTDGTRLTRRVAGTSDDAGIILREIRNGFGEVFRSCRADANGALVYSYNTFDARGLLARSETADLAPTLYEYGAFGDETKRTLALSDEPTVRNSRVRETETFYENRDGGVYRVVSSTTYDASGAPHVSSEAVLVSESAALESETVSTDVRGNATVRRTEYGSPTVRVSKIQIPTAENIASVRVVDGFTVSRTDHAGTTTSFARDFRTGENPKIVLTTTDGRGNATVEERDVLGRVTKKTDASGAVTTTAYAPGLDLPECVTDALGNARRFAYDLHGNTVAEYGAGTQPAVFAYDDADNRISQKLFRAEAANPDADPRERADGGETTWEYHAATGLLLRKTYPDGNAADYAYDSLNRLVSTTLAREVSDGVRLKITRAYASKTGELVSVSCNDGASETQTYAYNFLGQLTSQTDSSGTAAYAYDAYGSRVSETRTGTLYSTEKTLAFHFDAFGRDVGYSIDGERKTTVSYDPATGRIASCACGDASFSWEYLAGTDLKSKLTYPNSATAEWTYEAERDLLSNVKNTVNGNVISQYAYVNDALGRRTAMSKSGTMMSAAETISYGYNSRSELVSTVSNTDSAYDYAYAFDAIGNRETSSESGTSLAYASNALNQYTSYGRSDNPVASAVQTGIQNDFSSQSDVAAPQGIARSSASSSEATGTSLLPFEPTYDADGNMTLIQTPTGTWSVSYDAHNRPVTWTNSAGEKIYMMYDAQGRRVEKRVLNASGQRTLRERYVYVGYTCVQVLNGDDGNAVVKEFAWNPTEPVATRPLMFKYVPNGVTMFYAFDGNKNVSDVFCWAVQNGVPAHYDYAPFGAITRTAKNTPFTLDFVSLNPWRFSSEFCDPELDLVYYNYRHYSTSLGRFLSRDPIEEQGGLNLYAFVGNCSIIFVDMLGLDRYVFDGDQICRISDDGKECYKCWQAVSGRPGKNDVFDYTAEQQKKKEEGPIPEGKYQLPGRRTTDPSNTGGGYWHRNDWNEHSGPLHWFLIQLGLSKCSHVRLKGRRSGPWGSRWGRLIPEEGTDVYGRCDFNIHGGTQPGSAGCIDVGCNDEDFFDDVNAQDQDFVDVEVDYSKESTKACCECENKKGNAWPE